MNGDIFKGYGVEVEIKENDFLKIVETLTRIGVYSKKTNSVVQSVHLLHKKDHYAIIHFKELFGLDGKETDISDNDLARRNTVASLLEEWELLTIKYPEEVVDFVPISELKIIPFKDKSNYNLISKYTIGKKK